MAHRARNGALRKPLQKTLDGVMKRGAKTRERFVEGREVGRETAAFRRKEMACRAGLENKTRIWWPKQSHKKDLMNFSYD